MIQPTTTFEEEMSRFEAEIGNRTVAGQLVNNPSNPYQQPPLGMTMLHQQLPPQKYLGTTVPGNVFPATRPSMIPPTLINTNKPPPFTNISSSNIRTSFPPPPPAVVLSNVSSTSSNPTASTFQSAPSRMGTLNKRYSSLSSAPTIYSAAATTQSKDDDDDDILAILQKTEKEVKKDAKELKKTGAGSFMSFKPSSVSASESNKKAKLMADSVRSSSTTTIKTVQVPQSTKDRMLGMKTDKMER